MTHSPDHAERALTSGEHRALSLLPTWGFPAGHNQWPDVEYADPDDTDRVVCSGDDMNALLRRGFAATGARCDDDGVHLVDEDRECEARWRIEITDEGRAALHDAKEVG